MLVLSDWSVPGRTNSIHKSVVLVLVEWTEWFRSDEAANLVHLSGLDVSRLRCDHAVLDRWIIALHRINCGTIWRMFARKNDDFNDAFTCSSVQRSRWTGAEVSKLTTTLMLTAAKGMTCG